MTPERPPFRLTMPEPRADRRPYQVSDDAGGAWRGLLLRELVSLLELYATFPDEDRERVDSGATVRLQAGTLPVLHVRRRPTEAEAFDAAHQPRLF